MDLATLIGIISGFGLVIIAILTKSSESAGKFLDISSFLIVFGGSVAASLISFPLEKIKNSVNIAKNVFKNSSEDTIKTIEKIGEISYVAKKDGLLAMEKFVDDIENDFFKKGIMLVIDGIDGDSIKGILELEVENMQARHGEGEAIFRALGKFAPAFGMIGTLIGLIIMLNNLEDISTLGPSMSIALVTTFYGALLANAVFVPIADKLKFYSEKEIEYKMLIIEGVIAIQTGESPYLIREKLKTFISTKKRYDDEKGEADGSQEVSEEV